MKIKAFFSVVKTGAICFLIFVCHNLTAQKISGKVFRNSSDSTIAGASVYYSGSVIGTTTDENGEFELDGKQQQIPIVISCVGYYTSVVKSVPGKSLMVFLKPKVHELHEVVVYSPTQNREKAIEIFTREFLGTSKYAKKCLIKNLDDVRFYYSKKTGTLSAVCDSPLIIENKALGYRLKYFLDRFEASATGVSFIGNYIFTDNADASQLSRIKRSREAVYADSRMYFIRTLWARKTNDSEFFIYTRAYKRLNEDSILIEDSNRQKFISFKNKIIIESVSDDKIMTTVIKLNSDSSFINNAGFYDTGITWEGFLAKQRVGDMLPAEYWSKKDRNLFVKPKNEGKKVPVKER
jgi:hypothetical protein